MNTNGGDGWMDAHEKGEMNGQVNDIMNALVLTNERREKRREIKRKYIEKVERRVKPNQQEEKNYVDNAKKEREKYRELSWFWFF